MKKIQLSIPGPCHQNWDDMTPTQQGRYCNACAKEVIDFSEMSDAQVLNYFNTVKNDTVCGRAYPDQLDRDITLSSTKKITWYWNYAVAFFLLFGKANKAKAQTVGFMLPKPADTSTTLHPVKKQSAQKHLINGVIKDESGQAVPFATVKLVHSNNGTRTDDNGKFALTIQGLDCVIEISALNYKTQRVTVNDLSDKAIVLTKTTLLMEEIIVSSLSRGRRMGGLMSRCTYERRNVIKDSITKWISNFNPSIKIYPNPVPKGNAFTVSFKTKQKGGYTIQITDATGRIIVARKINAAAKEHNEALLSGSTWSGGIYYLRVVDEKGKPVGTGSFAVQ